MTDIPAPQRRCYGLRPGAPCPAYDDGTYPDGCDCMVNLRHYDGSLTTAGAVVGFIVFVLLFIAVWAISDAVFGAARAADSATPCLTKEQARAKWPNQWIFWHGSNHCWDNVRGTAATANKPDNTVQIIRAPKPNRAAKADRSLPIDASGNATARRVSTPVTQGRPSIYYPELMGGGGTSSGMLHPYVATEWQPITNFDEEPVPFIPWIRTTPLVNK